MVSFIDYYTADEKAVAPSSLAQKLLIRAGEQIDLGHLETPDASRTW
jgi:hypothetical protein